LKLFEVLLVELPKFPASPKPADQIGNAKADFLERCHSLVVLGVEFFQYLFDCDRLVADFKAALILQDAIQFGVLLGGVFFGLSVGVEGFAAAYDIAFFVLSDDLDLKGGLQLLQSTTGKLVGIGVAVFCQKSQGLGFEAEVSGVLTGKFVVVK
jgi:hypothetical protein